MAAPTSTDRSVTLRSPFKPEVEQREALLFSQTVEGLLRALGPLSPADAERFRALGLVVDQPLAPAYPVAAWIEMLKLGAKIHAPTLPIDDALQSLGRKFVDGYGETTVGKAMIIGMRMLGPRRTLERFSRNLMTGSTFFKSEVSQLADKEWALWINRVTWPGWYFGLIQRGLDHAGARDVSVSVMVHEAVGGPCCMRVKWS